MRRWPSSTILRGEEAGFGRAAWQHRRGAAGAAAAGVRPDVLTDQTSAHDPVNGYLPAGLDRRGMGGAAREGPESGGSRRARQHGGACADMLALSAHGRAGVRLRQQHPAGGERGGRGRRLRFPGFVPAYIRPLFCRGVGPFRWAALSGDPEDIYKTDAKVKELIRDDPHLHHWLDMAREQNHFQGLPARICWVGLGRAAPAGAGFQRDGGERRALGAHRDRPRPSGFRFGGAARTARPRRCGTVPMPSRTGRC